MFDGKYARLRKPLYVALSAVGLLALVFIVSSPPTLLLLEKGANEAAAVTNAVNGIGDPIGSITNEVKSSVPKTRSLVKNVVAVIPPGSTTNNSAIQAVAGYYDIGVPQSVSLAIASSTIAQSGVQIVLEFPYLHVLVARLSVTQQAALTKNSSVSYIQPVQAASGAQASLTTPLLVSTLSPVISPANPVVLQGSPTVAIVDNFSTPTSHGYEVLSAYQAQCAAVSCADPNPTLISALDPVTGDMTMDSIDNGAIYAIDNGAKIVNMSTTCVVEVDVYGNASYGGAISDNDLNLGEIAQSNNAILVYAAGNNPNYVQPALTTPNNPYSASIVSVGLLGLDGQVDPASSVRAETYAPGTLPDGSWGTSFAAPTYAATLDANMHDNGEAYPSQATIAATDYTPGFIPSTQVSVTYNSNGTVKSVASPENQGAYDNESDEDDGNPDFDTTPPASVGDQPTNTAQPDSVNTGGPSNPLTTNPDDPTSQTPTISPDNTPTTPDTNTTPIFVDPDGSYSVTVTPTTPATTPDVNPDLTPSEGAQFSGRNGVTCETGPLNCK